jgi:hypothetical protein
MGYSGATNVPLKVPRKKNSYQTPPNTHWAKNIIGCSEKKIILQYLLYLVDSYIGGFFLMLSERAVRLGKLIDCWIYCDRL